MLDTLRASDFNVHTMPFTYALAKQGTYFERAIAPGTWTATSHASFFAGKRVTDIKEASEDFFTRGTYKIDPWMVKTKFLPANSNTLAKRLSRQYTTSLFSNNPFVTSFTNMGIGFDVVHDIWLHTNVKYNKKLTEKFSFVLNSGYSGRMAMYKASKFVASFIPTPILDKVYMKLRLKLDAQVDKADGTYRLDRGISDTNKLMNAYLSKYPYARHFMFINLIEPHENYPVGKNSINQDKWLYLSGIFELDEEIKKKLHDGYVRRLHYLDKKLYEAFGIMKRQGFLEDAKIIITSDHGQAFGEHGQLFHAVFPYEEIAHVPLAILDYSKGNLIPKQASIAEPVNIISMHKYLVRGNNLTDSIISSTPAITEHTSIAEGWDERLLLMLKDRSALAKKIYVAKKYYNTKAVAVYKGNYKLIHFFGRKKDQLFDITKDENETDNIIEKNRAVATSLLNYYFSLKSKS